MIKITRLTLQNTWGITYKVFIDDIYSGDLYFEKTKEFPVENGTYAIYVERGPCRSNTLHVDVNDSIVELEVIYTAFGNYTSIGSFTKYSDKFLALRRKGEKEEAPNYNTKEKMAYKIANGLSLALILSAVIGRIITGDVAFIYGGLIVVFLYLGVRIRIRERYDQRIARERRDRGDLNDTSGG